VAAWGVAARISLAIEEGDIGWWGREGEQVDWALCCLARNLVAEEAVNLWCGQEEADMAITLDLKMRIMTPRAYADADVFDYLPAALARVMEVNVLVVSRSATAPYTCYSDDYLGDKDSTEFQIRVLTYDNHYFLWRPPWAESLCDKVCIQEKEKRQVVERARKKRTKKR
jgi:hypothetical protein